MFQELKKVDAEEFILKMFDLIKDIRMKIDALDLTIDLYYKCIMRNDIL